MLEIGKSLREARSSAGLELADVEASTMIPSRYLEALEEERFDRLPAGPYRRSFLGEYAEFLGLDRKSFTAEYDLVCTPPQPDPPAPSRRSAGEVTRVLGEISPKRLAAVAVLALLGVAVWQLGGSGQTAHETTAQAPVRGRPASRRRPSIRPTPAVTAPKPAAAPQPSLTLTAVRGECWLLVRVGSSAGAAVYEHTLQQGQTVRFGLRRPLWIRLGAPWNLNASLGHTAVTSQLPTRTGDLVARTSGLRAAA